MDPVTRARPQRPRQGGYGRGGVPMPARVAAGVLALAFVGLLFATAQSGPPPAQTDLPPVGKVAGETKKAPPFATPAPVTPAASATPTATPTPTPTPKR